MPNYNPYFSNVVKPSSGGLRTGGLANKIIGGIADEARAQRSYEYASKLIQDRTIGDVVGHMAKSDITREHLKGTYADELEHGKNVTAAANEGTFDPNILLRIGNTHLQARGQGFRPPKKVEEPTIKEDTTEKPTTEVPTTEEDTAEVTRRPTLSDLEKNESDYLEQKRKAAADGPTADKGPDQPVTPAGSRRKKSAAKPKKDKSTVANLSSKSIASDLSDKDEDN